MFLLLTTIPVMSAAEPSPAPRQFSASIGGFLGPTYQLEWRDGTLTYTSFSPGQTKPKRAKVTPTAAQWREFRQALDDLKVWQWRAAYPSRGVQDGTQWALEITYADHAIKTRGDNNYPGANGKPNDDPNATKSFNRYLDAVTKLIGGKTFR